MIKRFNLLFACVPTLRACIPFPTFQEESPENGSGGSSRVCLLRV